MGRTDEQSAMVAAFAGRPFQRRTGAGGTQKAQPCCRAGFQRAAHAAAVACRANRRFGGRLALQVDDLLAHLSA